MVLTIRKYTYTKRFPNTRTIPRQTQPFKKHESFIYFPEKSLARVNKTEKQSRFSARSLRLSREGEKPTESTRRPTVAKKRIKKR